MSVWDDNLQNIGFYIFINSYTFDKEFISSHKAEFSVFVHDPGVERLLHDSKELALFCQAGEQGAHVPYGHVV